jgi:uncharacterized protein HemX
MALKPSTWYPIAIFLSGLNLIAVPVYSGDAMHALAHGMAAVAFGLWAQRLRQRRDHALEQQAIEGQDASRMELLEDELTRLRHELTEAQERLDFTERMLAQRAQQDSARGEPRR